MARQPDVGRGGDGSSGAKHQSFAWRPGPWRKRRWERPLQRVAMLFAQQY